MVAGWPDQRSFIFHSAAAVIVGASALSSSTRMRRLSLPSARGALLHRHVMGRSAVSRAPLCSTAVETRCAHCFITFATPQELAHHSAHHCFPDDPAETLRRFPVGAEALDFVSQERIVVLGAASNTSIAHSAVSTRDLANSFICDRPISRLQLLAAGRRDFGTLRMGSSPAYARGLCSGGSPSPSFRTEPLIPIPHAAVGEVAQLIGDGRARYIDCRSESELGGGVVPKSVNIPFPHNGNAEVVQPAEFLLDVECEGFKHDQTVFVGCRTGARSALAAEVLINAGFTDVRNVDGGIVAWVASGLPIQPFAG